jgi:hypothetical protein
MLSSMKYVSCSQHLIHRGHARIVLCYWNSFIDNLKLHQTIIKHVHEALDINDHSCTESLMTIWGNCHLLIIIFWPLLLLVGIKFRKRNFRRKLIMFSWSWKTFSLLEMMSTCWEWIGDLNLHSCVEKNKNLTWQSSYSKAISRLLHFVQSAALITKKDIASYFKYRKVQIFFT